MKFIDNFYKRGYKFYLIVPLIILVVGLILSFSVPKSIDLKGGTYLTINSEVSGTSEEIESYLQSEFGLRDVSVQVKNTGGNFLNIEYITPEDLLTLREEIATIKDSKDIELASNFLESYGINLNDYDLTSFDSLKSGLDLVYTSQKNDIVDSILLGLHNKFGVDTKNYNLREVDPVLGDAFFSNAITVAIWAAILVTIVILLFFRKIVPSAAVILAGVLDVIGALGGMALFGIPLSLITIPALLMLVGYSVDTDIMLTTKLLKRSGGTPRSRASEAMKTGLTMTMTTLVALLSMFIVSYLYNVEVIFSISAVLLIGLVIDIISTWLMNAPILLWYVERQKKAK